MDRINFTQYDEYPEDMLTYLRNYGPHFNKKLAKFAASKMYKLVNGQKQYINAYSKEDVMNILSNYNIVVDNAQLCDCVYVANMCKADFLGSSVIDEQHLAKYIKDVIDDSDAPDGLVFNRFYADCCYKGIAIEWSDML